MRVTDIVPLVMYHIFEFLKIKLQIIPLRSDRMEIWEYDRMGTTPKCYFE